MYPLLVCSIAAVTVGINRYLFLRKRQRKGFTEKFCTLVENNDWEGAKKLTDSTEGEIAKLATIVMDKHEITSTWKTSFLTGQNVPWINLRRTWLCSISSSLGPCPRPFGNGHGHDGVLFQTC